MIKLLRGGFCAIWITGFFTGFVNFSASLGSEPGSPDALNYLKQGVVCVIIAVIGVIVHAHLLLKEEKDE